MEGLLCFGQAPSLAYCLPSLRLAYSRFPEVSGENQNEGEEDLSPGKSLVYGVMEVCMCVLTRHVPGLIPHSPTSALPPGIIVSIGTGSKGTITFHFHCGLGMVLVLCYKYEFRRCSLALEFSGGNGYSFFWVGWEAGGVAGVGVVDNNVELPLVLISLKIKHFLRWPPV